MSFVTEHAARSGVGEVKSARLELAVEEWATNVCRHAYRGKEGPMTVAMQRDGTNLYVELSDEGMPFDPTAGPIPDVTLPLGDRKSGGLGLLLIRRLVDALSYRRDGPRNVLTVTVRGDR